MIHLTFHLNKAGTDFDVSGVTVMATVSVCDVVYCVVCFDAVRPRQQFFQSCRDDFLSSLVDQY